MTFKINKNLTSLLILAVFGLFCLPRLSNAAVFEAAPTGQVINIEGLLLVIIDRLIWPVVVTVVIIFFLMAGFKFLNAQGNPEEIKTARRFVIWGTAGVVVIIFAFSIIVIIRNTIGVI